MTHPVVNQILIYVSVFCIGFATGFICSELGDKSDDEE